MGMENITDTSFHGGKENHQRYYHTIMKKAVSDGRITERESKQIQAFISEIKACGKLSSQRAYKLAYQLIGWKKYLPEFSQVDTVILYSGLEALKSDNNYTDSTKKDYITILKRFLLWLNESGDTSPGLKMEKLRKVNAGSIQVTKTADDILEPDQIDLLFKHVSSTRNRAMLELLYESGGRAGEIATMRWGQITFYQNYASVRLDGKTGKTRVVPLYSSHVALRLWKNQYGKEPAPDDLIFPGNESGDQTLSYNGVLKIVRTAARKAGIEKRIGLHTFRHSRITHLLRSGLNESTIKLLAWGDVGSTMLKVYSHLTPGDVENSFNQLYGIKPVEEFRGMDPAVSPAQCPACGMLNPAGNRFCGGCGAALTRDAAMEKAELQALASKEIMQMTEEKMRELILLMKEAGEI